MVVLGQATTAPGYTVSTFEVPTKHEMPSKIVADSLTRYQWISWRLGAVHQQLLARPSLLKVQSLSYLAQLPAGHRASQT